MASLISSSLGFETGRLEVSKWMCSAISSSMLPYAVSGSGALEGIPEALTPFLASVPKCSHTCAF